MPKSVAGRSLVSGKVLRAKCQIILSEQLEIYNYKALEREKLVP